MTNVIKANGDKEVFSEDKLRYSIKRAGIPKGLEEKVISHVKSKLYEGIPTKEVYRHLTEFLGKDKSFYGGEREGVVVRLSKEFSSNQFDYSISRHR